MSPARRRGIPTNQWLRSSKIWLKFGYLQIIKWWGLHSEPLLVERGNTGNHLQALTLDVKKLSKLLILKERGHLDMLRRPNKKSLDLERFLASSTRNGTRSSFPLTEVSTSCTKYWCTELMSFPVVEQSAHSKQMPKSWVADQKDAKKLSNASNFYN